MKIKYTREARKDVRAIGEYLQEQAPEATQRVIQTIKARVGQLQNYPRLGRPTREPRIRQLSVGRYPYTIYDRIDADAISVVHIRHQSRAPWLAENP